MDTSGDDLSFEFKLAGSMIAMRFIVRALILTHPDKAALRAALKAIVEHPQSGAETQAAPVQIWIDRILGEQMGDIR